MTRSLPRATQEAHLHRELAALESSIAGEEMAGLTPDPEFVRRRSELRSQLGIPGDTNRHHRNGIVELRPARDAGAVGHDSSSDEAKVPRLNLGGADQILDLVAEMQCAGSLKLFHDLSGDPYVTVSAPVVAGSRTLDVRSKDFERIVLGTLIGRQRKAGNRVRAVTQAAWTDASRTLAALAVHEGPSLPVYSRVARIEDPSRIVVDLGDENGRAVEVTSEGWCVTEEAPVAFRRPPSMRPLPVPAVRGDCELLRRYVHVSDTSYPLVLAWIVNALAGTVPFALLVLYGEQGSAKSTSARFIRRLVDPGHPDLRALPRDERDLLIAADNNYLLAFDNLSGLDSRSSDALCRLSDGSGFGTRRLYSDREEETFSGARPILLTGIEPAANAADLLDRSYLVEAPRIADTERRGERELFAAFERDRPRIFGSLLDAVSTGLAQLDAVVLKEAPRREDAARFAIAAEPGLGLQPGTIRTSLEITRQQAMTVATESSPFVEAVLELIEEKGSFEGTMKDLLALLNERRGDSKPARGWPSGSVAGSRALHRGAPVLRGQGVDVEFLGPSGKQRERLWRLGLQNAIRVHEEAL